ncbi:MAG: hypothetical protein KAJ19_24870 [Gammaproteobacteria bacterium]|nr:hypothetical protein [Gammaproteobacteria bacterium]
MPDYIPPADAAFDTWADNFVNYLVPNSPALGLLAADIAALGTAHPAWRAAYFAHTAAQTAAQAARQTKDDARSTLETEIRSLTRRLQASTAVDDSERAALGITVPDTVATAAAVPATRPLVTVDTSQRLRHVIAFVDEGTPTRRAKPKGVMGVEIWVKIGDPPPTDPNELTFLSVDTRTPYTADFSGGDAKKTAHYMARWVNTKGEKGPWSETASATIGA